ncbi:MAG: suppressor of fused domain protein [Verrucomicrobiota bacterium]
MLDKDTTQQRFMEWLRSRGSHAALGAAYGTPRWPFVMAGVSVLCAWWFRDHGTFLLFVLLPLFFLLHGYNLAMRARAARRDAPQAFANHVPVLCGIVIGNTNLSGEKRATAPALLVGSFAPCTAELKRKTLELAETLGDFHGEDPATVPMALREACKLVNDDSYQPNRRREVPRELSGGETFWLFDALLRNEALPQGELSGFALPFMASPAPGSPILQIPPDLVAFKEEPYDPNIIVHKTPESFPPLVAPVSENLDAVEKHIERHLGSPETVFHELISTTVHIDVHFVAPTPEQPWISLVTSGMSDIPMNAPAGAEDWRFSELMIRLPADWKLSDEAFQQEENYWPVRALKFLARFPHEYETWLSYGHTIPNGNPPEPFAAGLPFMGMILSPPLVGGEDLATLRLADGTQVHFWSLIPLYASEMEFKLKHGADALLDRLIEAGHSDLFDPKRPPVA